MPQLHRLSAWSLYLLICGFFLYLAVYNPVAYIWMTYEDLYGEWLQTWLFVGVCLLAAAAARRPGSYRWFLVFLSVAGFYTFMEEISWGQRLLGIESPEFFEEYNVQGETNLHNLLTGPESTVLKDVVEYTLGLALLVYGLVYPLALRNDWAPARLLSGLGIAPPPLYLWPFFVNAAFFEVGWFDFNEAEVAEILVGTALVIMLLHYLLVEDRDGNSMRHAGVAYLAAFGLFVALAWGTTTLVYGAPEMRERIEARVVNGYKKYAGRMERRERWGHAADFYRRVYEAQPLDIDMLRGAVTNYRAAADEANYRKYYRLLLEETVTDKVIADTSVENQLTLASSYAEIDEQGAVQQYLDRALFFGTERARQFPDNPDNYYWLGRAHQQRGEFDKALEAYRKANSMEPDNPRYSSAISVLQTALAREEQG